MERRAARTLNSPVSRQPNNSSASSFSLLSFLIRAIRAIRGTPSSRSLVPDSWQTTHRGPTKKGVFHLRGWKTPIDEAFRILFVLWLIPFSLVRN